MASLGQPTFNLPPLNGTLDGWYDAYDKSGLVIGAGNKVETIINKAGDSTKDFTQASALLQGTWTKNAVNGRPAIMNLRGYTSGTTSSYQYMHDRSTPYGVFLLGYAIHLLGGSDIIYSTTNGGNTNGIFLNPFGTNGLRKTMRQADAGETISTDVINTWTGNNVFALDTFFTVRDVYYGYQIPTTDYALGVDGTTQITQADSTTSAFTSLPHKYPLLLGGNGGVHSFAEAVILTFAGLTPAQIDADIAALSGYSVKKYAIPL